MENLQPWSGYGRSFQGNYIFCRRLLEFQQTQVRKHVIRHAVVLEVKKNTKQVQAVCGVYLPVLVNVCLCKCSRWQMHWRILAQGLNKQFFV